MDMPRSAVAAGGALLLGLAGYFLYSKSSGTAAPAPTPVPAVVPATPAPTPIPTPEEASPTPTPSVLEMLNQRFPATAAGRVPQTPTVVTTNPPPVAYSNQPAPTATQAPAPTSDYRSTIDIERDKATSLLVPIMERMSASVRELTTLEGEFQKQCTGVMEMPYVDPYGNKIAGTMAKETTPECVSRKSRMTEIKTALPKDSAEVQDLARRNGILPGVVRDLVAKYQLGSYVR